MRTSIHERALKDAFYRAISEDPQIAAMAAEIRNNLLSGGFYAQDFVDASFQKWEGDREITLIEAYAFGHLWAYYNTGAIACCSVPLPRGPHKDREVELNQSILDQLPGGFRAKFFPERGRGADDDGVFVIPEGIGLWRSFRGDGDVRDESWSFAQERTVALEVGTTSVSKTLYHLRCRNGVARWPYGSNKIMVLAGVTTKAFGNVPMQLLKPTACGGPT
jgi:hypothetical protein